MADRYWVGGTANWDGTVGTKWATASGGAGGASIPTSADNVFFDAASGAVTVTMGNFYTASCANLTFTGFTGTFNMSSGGNSSGWGLDVYGNVLLVAGMTLSGSKGLLRFRAASGTKTFTTAGKTITCPLELDCTGATIQLQDNFTSSFSNNGSSSHNFEQALKITAGTWDANSKNMTFTGLVVQITGNLTTNLVNLTITGVAATSAAVFFGGDVTCSGTFTANGNSTVNRLILRSSVPGVQRTITAATVTCQNLDFQDINGQGAGSWNLAAITGLSGDCGGNSNITFTTAQDHYWVGNNGNWTATTSWSTTSGGASGARIPLPQDNVFFDNGSFNGVGQSATVNGDFPRMGKNMDWSAYNEGQTPTLHFSGGFYCENFGSITLISDMTITQGGMSWVWSARTGFTLTDGGKTFDVVMMNMPGATLTLGATLNIGTLFFIAGTFTTANNTVNAAMTTADAYLYNLSTITGSTGNGLTKTMNWGSSTINWNGGVSPFVANGDSNFVLNAGTSTLNVSAADGAILKCFHTVTFYDVNYTTPSSSLFDSRFFGGVFTVGHNFTITGAYTGSTPFGDIAYCNVAGVAGIGTTITVAGALTIAGASQQAPLNLWGRRLDVISTYQIIANGTVSLTDVNFHHMTVGGSALWAGTRVGDSGGNTGITFSSPRDLYWIGNGGNFQDNSHWSLSSGGSSATTYPLPQDLCIFDANSFNAGAQSVEVNVYYLPAMRWTGVTNFPALKFDDGVGLATTGYIVWSGGEYTFDSGMTFDDVNWSGYPNFSEPPSGTTLLTMDGHASLPGNNGTPGYWEINNQDYGGDAHLGTFKLVDDFIMTNGDLYGDGGTSLFVPVGVTWSQVNWDMDIDDNSRVYSITHTIHGTIAPIGTNAGFGEYQSSGAGGSSTTFAPTTTGRFLFDTDNAPGTPYLDWFSNTVHTLTPTIYMQGSVAAQLQLGSDGPLDRVEKKPNSSADLSLRINTTFGAKINTLIWDGKRGSLITIDSTTGAGSAALTLATDRNVSFCTINHIAVTGGLIAADCTDGGSNAGITFRDIKQRTYA